MQLRYALSVLVVLVAGATNLGFAWTLAIEPQAKMVMLGLSVISTLGTALGPHFIRQNCRNRHWGGALAALICFSCCLAWDGGSAFGFTARLHTMTGDTIAEAARQRGDAEADVTRAAADFARYAEAPDLTVARTKVNEIEAAVDTIDKQPGVIYRGSPCARVRGDDIRELCARRARLTADSGRAKTVAAEAEAKSRAELKLATARRVLNSLPVAAPGDPRAQVLGEWAVEWGPAVLLTLLATFSVLSVPSTTSKSAPGRPAPAEATEPPAAAGSPPQRRRKGARGSSRAREIEMAQQVAAMAANPPAGVFVDRDGWARGAQRALAKATGYGTNVSRFNRELHEAAAAETVELDTRGNQTAIRVKAPA